MKFTTWIREGAKGELTMRTDTKYESQDTPKIQRYGRRLVDALEGTCYNVTTQQERKDEKTRAEAALLREAVAPLLALDLTKLPSLNPVQDSDINGALYTIAPAEWSRFQTLLDVVNGVRHLQKSLWKP